MAFYLLVACSVFIAGGVTSLQYSLRDISSQFMSSCGIKLRMDRKHASTQKVSKLMCILTLTIGKGWTKKQRRLIPITFIIICFANMLSNFSSDQKCYLKMTFNQTMHRFFHYLILYGFLFMLKDSHPDSYILNTFATCRKNV